MYLIKKKKIYVRYKVNADFLFIMHNVFLYKVLIPPIETG